MNLSTTISSNTETIILSTKAIYNPINDPFIVGGIIIVIIMLIFFFGMVAGENSK